MKTLSAMEIFALNRAHITSTIAGARSKLAQNMAKAVRKKTPYRKTPAIILKLILPKITIIQ